MEKDLEVMERFVNLVDKVKKVYGVDTSSAHEFVSTFINGEDVKRELGKTKHEHNFNVSVSSLNEKEDVEAIAKELRDHIQRGKGEL